MSSHVININMLYTVSIYNLHFIIKLKMTLVATSYKSGIIVCVY